MRGALGTEARGTEPRGTEPLGTEPCGAVLRDWETGGTSEEAEQGRPGDGGRVG